MISCCYISLLFGIVYISRPGLGQITEGANRGEPCDPSFATPCKGKNNICDSSNICACLNSEYQPEAQGNDCYECKDAKSCVDIGYHTDWRAMTCVFKTCQCTSGYATRGSGTERICVKEVCPYLGALTNGSIQQEGIAIGDTATYVCDVGYDVVLSSSALNPRVCQADGTWTGDDNEYSCSPLDCGPVPIIQDGTITAQATTYSSVATVTCNADLVPSFQTIFCSVRGNWSAIPSCDPYECPDLQLTDGVSINNTGNTVGSTAMFGCLYGYEYSDGDSVLTCTASGWNGTTMECTLTECIDPLVFAGIEVNYTSKTHGSNVTYSCVYGYEITMGDTTLVCENGYWMGNPLICSVTDCRDPPVLTGATVNYSSTTHGSTVSYTCDLGYEYIRGDLNLTCDAGVWTGSQLTCSVQGCPDPTTSDGLVVNYTTTTHGSVVQYSCQTGYVEVSGDATVQCNAGAWFGTPLTCQITDCLAPPTYAGVNASYTNTTHGSVVVYTCSTGYEVENGNTALQCEAGSWSGTPLMCHLIDCSSPPTVPDATVNFSISTHGSVATYSCSPGFRSTDGDSTLVCDAGIWNGSALNCTIMDCLEPPLSTGSVADYNSTTYGSEVTYTCSVGYEPDGGNTSLRCDETGTWDGCPLECKLVDCLQPPLSTGSVVDYSSTTYGSEVTYTCSVGYEPDGGNTSLRCDKTGTWDGYPLECKLIDCLEPPLSSLSVADYNSTTYGSEVTYSCNVGYEPDGGNTSLRCDKTGTWDGYPLECKLVDCLQPPLSTGSVADYNSTTYGSEVTYTCSVGYEPDRGNTSLRCDKTGTWDGYPLECKLIDCQHPPDGDNAVANYTSTTHGSSMTYICDVGYEPACGDVTVYCDEGTWLGIPLTCVQIDCFDPLVTVGVTANFTATTFGYMVTYTCNTGYEHSGGDLLMTCGQTGWLGQPVNCTPVDCGIPRSPLNGQLVSGGGSTYQATADVQCKQDYVASTNTIRCEKTGRWSSTRCTLNAKNAPDIPPRILAESTVALNITGSSRKTNIQKLKQVIRSWIGQEIYKTAGILMENIIIDQEGSSLTITLVLNETLLTDVSITVIGTAVIGALKGTGKVFHVDGEALKVVGEPVFDIGYEQPAYINSSCFWYMFTNTCVAKGMCDVINGQQVCRCEETGCDVKNTGSQPDTMVPVILILCGGMLLLVGLTCCFCCAAIRRRRSKSLDKRRRSASPQHLCPHSDTSWFGDMYGQSGDSTTDSNQDLYKSNGFTFGKYVLTSPKDNDAIYAEITLPTRAEKRCY